MLDGFLLFCFVFLHNQTLLGKEALIKECCSFLDFMPGEVEEKISRIREKNVLNQTTGGKAINSPEHGDQLAGRGCDTPCAARLPLATHCAPQGRIPGALRLWAPTRASRPASCLPGLQLLCEHCPIFQRDAAAHFSNIVESTPTGGQEKYCSSDLGRLEVRVRLLNQVGP